MPSVSLGGDRPYRADIVSALLIFVMISGSFVSFSFSAPVVVWQGKVLILNCQKEERQRNISTNQKNGIVFSLRIGTAFCDPKHLFSLDERMSRAVCFDVRGQKEPGGVEARVMDLDKASVREVRYQPEEKL